MPFDNAPTTFTELRFLSYRLRNRDTWPEGFEWDFSHCHSCAMGLLLQLHDKMDYCNVYRVTSEKLDISYSDARILFGGVTGFKRNIPTTAVTPDMVADDIDDWLKNH